MSSISQHYYLHKALTTDYDLKTAKRQIGNTVLPFLFIFHQKDFLAKESLQSFQFLQQQVLFLLINFNQDRFSFNFFNCPSQRFVTHYKLKWSDKLVVERVLQDT